MRGSIFLMVVVLALVGCADVADVGLRSVSTTDTEEQELFLPLPPDQADEEVYESSGWKARASFMVPGRVQELHKKEKNFTAKKVDGKLATLVSLIDPAYCWVNMWVWNSSVPEGTRKWYKYWEAEDLRFPVYGRPQETGSIVRGAQKGLDIQLVLSKGQIYACPSGWGKPE